MYQSSQLFPWYLQLLMPFAAKIHSAPKTDFVEGGCCLFFFYLPNKKEERFFKKPEILTDF